MENAPNLVAQTPAHPSGHSGHHLLWGIVLFIVGLVVGGAAVWYVGPTMSTSDPVESPSPSPTSEAEVISEVESGWTLFTSDHGFSFQYPTGLRTPKSLCGGMGVGSGPAEQCHEVSVSSVLAVQEFGVGGGPNDSVNIAVVDDEGLSAQAYAEALLRDATIHEPLASARLGDASGFRAVFSRVLFHNAHQAGGTLYDAENVLFVGPAGEGKHIRVMYPRQFCSMYKYSSELDMVLSFQSECYADDRVELYEMIAETLMLNEHE